MAALLYHSCIPQIIYVELAIVVNVTPKLNLRTSLINFKQVLRSHSHFLQLALLIWWKKQNAELPIKMPFNVQETVMRLKVRSEVFYFMLRFELFT